jgi:hypothetical protein
VEQLLQAAAAAGPFRLGLDETQLAGPAGAAASSKSVRVGVVKVRQALDAPLQCLKCMSCLRLDMHAWFACYAGHWAGVFQAPAL